MMGQDGRLGQGIGDALQTGAGLSPGNGGALPSEGFVGSFGSSGKSIVMVTCYDYSFARALDGAVDYFLVGDSAAMVVYGDKDTKSISLETMLSHVKAVCRGSEKTRVIADMPIHSYDSAHDALQNALKFKDSGAYAVKMEGTAPSTLEAVMAVSAKMPVLGHVGLTPQWLDEYKLQGKEPAAAQRIFEEALALQNAGCFAVVLECVPSSLAQKITSALKIPTIGIGAGPHCGGQVLVLYDLLGLYGDIQPKFVKRYAEIGKTARETVEKYAEEVKNGKFPDEQHSFK